MKATVTSIILVALIIGGAIALSSSGSSASPTLPVNNISIVDGKQIIEIRAKGGFLPRRSIAQAGLPTVLRFDTNGTLDCSSVVRIPSLGISKSLPLSGVTDIDLGNPKVSTLQGTCGMGMYPFEVEFRS